MLGKVLCYINLDNVFLHNDHAYNILYVFTYTSSCVSTGLIIDAFGELRDQLEQVKEDMEVSFPLGSLADVVCSTLQLF